MTDENLEEEIYQQIMATSKEKAGRFSGIARRLNLAPDEKEAREMARITAEKINEFKNPINLLLGFLSGGNLFDRLGDNVRGALEEAGYGKWADAVADGVVETAQERMSGGGIFSFLGGGQEQGATQNAGSSLVPNAPAQQSSADSIQLS